MSRWRWLLLQVSRRLWVRASLIGALGVLAAGLATLGERLFWSPPWDVSQDAVESMLDVIASSMLAVTTFSLSVMTAAYAAATSNVTPRATKLLMRDRATQNVLSTFIGSFIFGVVGLVALQTGAYGARGRAILFAVTVAVIVLIVVALLRWIDHLTRLGRVGETTDRVEEAAREALAIRSRAPCLGAVPLRTEAPPEGAEPVRAAEVGYVQHVDMSGLSRIAEALDAGIHIAVLPGAFVHPGRTLAWVAGGLGTGGEGEGRRADLRKAFTLGAERSFDQDPRFGLVVLAEIAQRALSPAVNDPGTAIDVIGRGVRLLAPLARPPEPEAPAHPRLRAPLLGVADLLDDLYRPIARDGAGMGEVQLRLQKAFLALAELGEPDLAAAAQDQSRLALERSEAALALAADKAPLRDLAEAVAAAARQAATGRARAFQPDPRR